MRRVARPPRPVTVLVAVVAVALALVAPGDAHAGRSRALDVGEQWSGTEDLPASTVGWSVRNYKRRITSETNDLRARRGLARVRWRTCLNRHAQRWAERLAATGTFRHQDLHRVLRRCHLRRVGENLALGYTNPSATLRAWMWSSGHRANLLDRSHRLTGVGMARGRRGWVTVQLLGRP